MSEQTNKPESLDLGAMMDDTLDTIVEAPDFVAPPDGSYTVQVKDVIVDKYTSKDEPNVPKQRLKYTYEILATLGLVNDREQPVPDHSLFSETFQGTLDGLSYFKKRARGIMNVSTLDGVPMREILSSLKGVSFDCTIKTKTVANPKKPGEVYENLQIRVIPPKA